MTASLGRVVARRPVVRLVGDSRTQRHDELAGEEPMELRVDGSPVSVTMRTPGHDFELALGFCLAEGIIDDAVDVGSLSYCGDVGPDRYNVVQLHRRVAVPLDELLHRRGYTTSACGVCGTASIEALRDRAAPLHDDEVRVDAAVLVQLPDALRQAQRVFERTGGLHAAGLFAADGQLRCVREDVGRHNAVDKVIGWAAMHRHLPLRGNVLMVSGRVAFEIVHKAALAGIPVIAAVSAPTSLAVELAEQMGMTLAGFIRSDTMNLYTGVWRITA